MKIDILTLFPEFTRSYTEMSVIGRAVSLKKIDINSHNIRDFTLNKQRQVDDAPYGGRQGMLMTAQPIYDCYMSIASKSDKKPHTIFMSPSGAVLTQDRVKELSEMDEIIIICGHYEGVDQRVVDEIVDEEISIGDYVVSGGELPALILVDSIARLCDGVLSERAGFEDESHYHGLLEHPQYTRPEVWMDRKVPEVLLSGHHANIAKWKEEKSIERTKERRKDLYERFLESRKKEK